MTDETPGQDTTRQNTPLTGLKFDSSKPDLSLLPFEALAQVSQAFMFGEKKYGRYNYLGGMQWVRIAAGAMRHVSQWLWVSSTDPESGLSHLAHAGACIFMLISYEVRGIGEDNRYKSCK